MSTITQLTRGASSNTNAPLSIDPQALSSEQQALFDAIDVAINTSSLPKHAQGLCTYLQLCLQRPGLDQISAQTVGKVLLMTAKMPQLVGKDDQPNQVAVRWNQPNETEGWKTNIPVRVLESKGADKLLQLYVPGASSDKEIKLKFVVPANSAFNGSAATFWQEGEDFTVPMKDFASEHVVTVPGEVKFQNLT